jgi:hypothetical protein
MQPVPSALRRKPEKQSKSQASFVHLEKPFAGAVAHAVHGPAGSHPMAGDARRHCELPGQSFSPAGHADPSGASPASSLPAEGRAPPAAVAPPDRPLRAPPLPASRDEAPRPPLPISAVPPVEVDVAPDPPLLVVSDAPPLPSSPPEDVAPPEVLPPIPSSAGKSFDSCSVDAHATTAQTRATPAKT